MTTEAVVYTGDLIFSSKITSTGAAVNVPVRVVRGVDDLAPGAALLLVALPEIGKRTADTIIAELSGKVDRFLDPGPVDHTGDAAPSGSALVMRDAVAALTQLGEPKLHARQLVEQAFALNPALDTPDALVAAAYRVRAGDQQA